MSRGIPLIFVDGRTGSGELLPRFKDAVAVELDSADFMFYGNGPDGDVVIGIERKRIGDLLNSITTGRLAGRQVPRMLKEYHQVYVVVEGIWRADPDTGFIQMLKYDRGWRTVNFGKRRFKFGDVWAFLTTMEVMMGIDIRMSRGPDETVFMVENLARWWGKEWEKHRSHMQMHKPAPKKELLRPGKPSIVRRIAAELPGVGFDRAMAVEKRFLTIADMIWATEEEWREVEGVGKLTAKAVWEALHLEE